MRYFEQVETYVKGSLSGEELVLFERELATNKDLQREVDLARMTELVIDTALKEELAAEIKSIRAYAKKGKRRSKVRRLRLWVPLAIAASIALMVGIFTPSDTDRGAFAAEYYQEYTPNFSNARGEASTAEEAAELLMSGQAAEAEQLILNSDNPNRYLLAHSLMMEEKYEEALVQFQVCVEADSYPQDQKSASEFYSALCWFGMGQPEQAIDQLNSILKDPGHIYKSPSEEVLKAWEE